MVFTLILLLQRRPSSAFYENYACGRKKSIQLLSGSSTDFSTGVSLIHPWIERDNSFKTSQLILTICFLGSPTGCTICMVTNMALFCMEAWEWVALASSCGSPTSPISDDGEAPLVDFGLTSLVNSTFGLPVSTGRTGAINWTAPEDLEESELTLEQDIWAYGMTTLELFTREPPCYDKPTM
ncbi:hypothetical protein EDC04DRAFT_371246 [Pisolithus marmoratus]|nr:hypothetical protein EDC04DRAFT_371246 [Pisolithus marmoratus]